MKICTPWPSRVESRSLSRVSFVSSMSKSARNRSRSASAVTSSRSLAWPRTIRAEPSARGGRPLERLPQALAGSSAARLDRLALVLADAADLQEPVHEEPQASLGRQAACRGVWRVEQARLFEVRHDVADGGGREVETGAARE